MAAKQEPTDKARVGLVWDNGQYVASDVIDRKTADAFVYLVRDREFTGCLALMISDQLWDLNLTKLRSVSVVDADE